MLKEEFAIAFSDKDGEEAIKEVSLKIKRMLPKKIEYLMLLFTPDYAPSQILHTINFTLKPNRLFCLQAPCLIFEDKSLQKGVVACCINKKGLFSREAYLEPKSPEEIESFFHTTFKNIRKRDYLFLSFLSPSINPTSYLSGIKFSLGEVFNLLGVGYMKKFAQQNYQIIGSKVSEGLTSIALRGIQMHFLKLGGYVPLGKPFKITKFVAQRNLIVEINGKPAANIYRHYVEEKFTSFMKKNLFSLYPLGIKKNDSLQLINIIECLQDGSLVYTGELKEVSEAQIMFLDTTSLFNNIKEKLPSFQNKGQGLVFMVNSLFRKRILKDLADEEIKCIKQALGNDTRIVGLYSDYCLCATQEKSCIDFETGNLILTLWD